MRPFKRPVIVGTEWVSFSALLTARHGGIRPVAMIEEASRITARRPADILARGLFGVPVLTRTRLTEILGTKRVEGVEIERDGKLSILDCDGVIFTGLFTPEATLVRTSHLALDEGTFGPAIDNHWRCSDPAYFAAGNVLRAVEHSGMAAAEGAAAARSVLRALRGDLPRPDEAVRVRTRGALAYAYPQRLCLGKEPIVLRARARVRLKGELRLTADDILLSRRRLEALPERRLTVKVDPAKLGGRNDLTLALE